MKYRNKIKRKIPGFDLGTMKPASLGYQPNYGVGSVTYETKPGEDLQPGIDTLKANRLPVALNNATTSTQMIPSMFNNTVTTPGSFFTGGLSLAPGTQTIGNAVGSSLTSLGNPATTSLSQVASAALKDSVQSGLFGTTSAAAAKGTATGAVTPTSTTLSTLGKALGYAGAAYGFANMGMQLADAGSHRDAKDMMSTMGRNTISTDKGNQYTQYTGPDLMKEVNYERANRFNKELGFGINAIGTGASLGGAIGGPIGLGIGAGAGLLLGGLGSLFGWFDNEEAVRRQGRLLTENVSKYNQQSEAVARSKDVAAEFADRTGLVAEGKEPGLFTKHTDKKYTGILVGPDGISYGQAGSKVEPGEEMYDPETYNGATVPGKGKGDKVLSSITEGDQNIVFSNKLGFSKLANPIIEEQMKLKKMLDNTSEKDFLGRDVQQKMIQQKLDQNNDKLLALSDEQNLVRETKNRNNYKCGKLPGYESGKWFDYIGSMLPGLAESIQGWADLNEASNMPVQSYNSYVDSPGWANAVNRLSSLRFDVNPYIRDIDTQYRHSLYDINRSPIYGPGGKMVAKANAFINAADAKAKMHTAAQDKNNALAATAAEAAAKYHAAQQQARMAANAQEYSWLREANAAKWANTLQSRKNRLTGFQDMMQGILAASQYHDALKYRDKTLGIWSDEVNNNKINPTRSKLYYSNPVPYIKPTGIFNNYVPSPLDDVYLQLRYNS